MTPEQRERAVACLPELVEAARQAVRNLGNDDSPGPINDMRRILARIDGHKED